MVSRKEREQEFKKGLIAEAARELFAGASFEKVTVEDIARRSQFGKGTIYQYFETKEEILVYVLCQAFDELLAAMRRSLEKGGEPAAILSDFIWICPCSPIIHLPWRW